MISSPLLSSEYERQLPQYEDHRNRMAMAKGTAAAAVGDSVT